MPVHIVQRQFEAYNAHDLSAFLATYAENAALYRAPSTEPVASGKAAISDLYATKVFAVNNHWAPERHCAGPARASIRSRHRTCDGIGAVHKDTSMKSKGK